MNNEPITIQELALISGVSDKTIRRYLRSLKLRKPDSYAQVVREEPTKQGKFIYKLDEAFFYNAFKVTSERDDGLSSRSDSEPRQAGQTPNGHSQKSDPREETEHTRGELLIENRMLKMQLKGLEQDKKDARKDVEHWQEMARNQFGVIRLLEDKVRLLESPRVRNFEASEIPVTENEEPDKSTGSTHKEVGEVVKERDNDNY